MSNLDLAWTRLELSLILCAAQSVYLLAFLFGPKLTIPDIDFRQPRNIRLVSLVFLLLLALICAIFIASQGGVFALLVAMRGGRQELFAGDGQFLFAGISASTIVLAWFMYEKRPWSNPVFLGGLVLSLMLAILSTGSRSAVILPVISILLLWWKRRGRVLLGPSLMVALFGLLVIGIFGSIRQDYGSKTIDFSVLDPSTYGSSLQRALEDISGRQTQESNLAAVAGANKDGLLWGESYINGVTFWVPRALWPDKPKTVDTYNMWYNFTGNPRSVPIRAWRVWGVPVGPEIEAFWNFWYPGVIVVFGFLGMLHATLAAAAHKYGKIAFFWAVYMLILMRFGGSTKEFVELTRNGILLFIFAYSAGIFRFSRGGKAAFSRVAKA